MLFPTTSIGDLLSNPFQRQEEMPYIHQRCNVNVALFEGGGHNTWLHITKGYKSTGSCRFAATVGAKRSARWSGEKFVNQDTNSVAQTI